MRCLGIGLLRASAIIDNYGHRQEDSGWGVSAAGGGGDNGEVRMRRMKRGKVVGLVEGVWELCSYLFIPQRRPKDYYNL